MSTRVACWGEQHCVRVFINTTIYVTGTAWKTGMEARGKSFRLFHAAYLSIHTNYVIFPTQSSEHSNLSVE